MLCQATDCLQLQPANGVTPRPGCSHHAVLEPLTRRRPHRAGTVRLRHVRRVRASEDETDPAAPLQAPRSHVIPNPITPLAMLPPECAANTCQSGMRGGSFCRSDRFLGDRGANPGKCFRRGQDMVIAPLVAQEGSAPAASSMAAWPRPLGIEAPSSRWCCARASPLPPSPSPLSSLRMVRRSKR